MAKYPAIPLYTDAYLADTRHLTAAQHGAYLLLLMMAWRQPDCALPDNDETLSRWASMDLRTWLRNRDAVMAFWKMMPDGRWQQPRLSDERHHAEDRRAKNAQACRSSALKRQGRHSTDVQPDANQNPTNPTPNTDTEVSVIENVKPTEISRRGSTPLTSIAVILEDLATISDELRYRASKHIDPNTIDDEWARFRNHHISIRSKHTRLDLCWDTWCRNAAKFAARRPGTRPGSAGQGGNGSRDVMASAKRAALAELTGQRPEELGGETSFDSYPAGHNAGIIGRAEAIAVGSRESDQAEPGRHARLAGPDSDTADRP